MRIIYVINSIKQSGPNQVLLSMVSGLADKKHDIRVVAFFDSNAPDEIHKLEKLGAKVHILDVTKGKIPTTGAKKLREYAEKCNPDIMHSHGILSDIAVIRADYKSKSVTTIHNNMFEDNIFTFGKLKGTAYILLHLWHLRKFAQVVCCSSDAQSKLKRYIKNTTFIHNGIPMDSGKAEEHIQLRKDLGIAENDRVFLYAGKLSTGKNIVELLEKFSLSRSKNEHLVVIGHGRLAEQCNAYAGEGVHLMGFQTDVLQYYQMADVYISASRSEGFSISVLEALQNGLVLLLSSIPAHQEVFDIDPSMYIGNTFSLDTLSECKSQLRYADNQSREYYRKYLTDAVMMKSYDKIYREIIP